MKTKMTLKLNFLRDQEAEDSREEECLSVSRVEKATEMD